MYLTVSQFLTSLIFSIIFFIVAVLLGISNNCIGFLWTFILLVLVLWVIIAAVSNTRMMEWKQLTDYKSPLAYL